MLLIKFQPCRYVPGLVWNAYLVLHSSSSSRVIFISHIYEQISLSLCVLTASDDQRGHVHQCWRITHPPVNVVAGKFPGRWVFCSILGIVWKNIRNSSVVCVFSFFFFVCVTRLVLLSLICYLQHAHTVASLSYGEHVARSIFSSHWMSHMADLINI